MKVEESGGYQGMSHVATASGRENDEETRAKLLAAKRVAPEGQSELR